MNHTNHLTNWISHIFVPFYLSFSFFHWWSNCHQIHIPVATNYLQYFCTIIDILQLHSIFHIKNHCEILGWYIYAHLRLIDLEEMLRPVCYISFNWKYETYKLLNTQETVSQIPTIFRYNCIIALQLSFTHIKLFHVKYMPLISEHCIT